MKLLQHTTTLLLLTSATLVSIAASASVGEPTKKQLDREAILSMAGCYKVSFDFAETFAPDTGYAYHDRYHSWGIEYVFVVNDQPDLIQLQHLLIVNDSTIIKHWRQDWVYEASERLNYDRENRWTTITYSPEEAEGTWTQKVYQVDDSPRYESTGTWVHLGDKHYWEGSGDAPLPRREFSKRSDYNVMTRHSRVELTEDGWVLEQDNEKIIRDEQGDKLLCWEKGMERFTTGDYDCQPAISWWDDQKEYWAGVRAAWEEVFAENETLALEKKIDEQLLWQRLFEAGDELAKAGTNPEASKQVAKEIIEKYIKAS